MERSLSPKSQTIANELDIKGTALSNEGEGIDCHLRRRKGKSKCEEHELSLSKATSSRYRGSETVVAENAACSTSTSKMFRYYGIIFVLDHATHYYNYMT